MCLAIGPASEPPRGPFARRWWLVAGSPLRLLGASAFLQAVGLAGAVLAAPESGRSPSFVRAVAGVALSLLLGWLFHKLPQWSGRSPIHYLRYGATAFGLGTGVLFLMLGALLAGGWWRAAAILFVFSGVVAFSSIRSYLPWLKPAFRRRAWFASLCSLTLSGALVALTLAL